MGQNKECDTPAILNPGWVMNSSEKVSIKNQIRVVLEMHIFTGSFSYIVLIKPVFI